MIPKGEIFLEPSSKKLSPTKNKARLLVLASGGGTTFEAIVEYSKSVDVAYEVVGLVTNNSRAGVLKRAKRLEVPSFHVPRDKDKTRDFYQEVLNIAKNLSVDVIVLAGFLLLVRDPLLKEYAGRILNTHPSLLPHFGGKGMYGERVHEAVIRSGHRESGVTIHLIDESYDGGQVLGFVKVPVLKEDNYLTLSERVRAEEKKLYPQVINQFVTSHGFS